MRLKPGDKVAVVGAGISGITAAYYLQNKYKVHLYEQADRLGGHTNTITVTDPQLGSVGIDTGFIVLNNRTYPCLHKLFSELSVAVRESDMSFSVVCEKSGLQYGSKNLSAIFGVKSNYAKLDYYKLLKDFPKFWKKSRQYLDSSSEDNIKVGEFVKLNRLSPAFVNNFIIPMGSAIWSSPDANILEFPLRFFLRFFNNHGMLSYTDQPMWQTVVGGSNAYIRAFEKSFKGKVYLNHSITKILKTNGKIVLQSSTTIEEYSHVVLATPANISAKLMYGVNDTLVDLLNCWSYQDNTTILHTDASWLPQNSKIQSSWNYLRASDSTSEGAVSITYDMNRLQGLCTNTNYCVTLNPNKPIAPDKILYQTVYSHPQYTVKSEQAQKVLNAEVVDRDVSIAGAFCAYGFHEDGCKSGVKVAERLLKN